MTKDLARAAFFRDCRKDYKRAFQIVEEFVRSVVDDSAFWEKVDGTPDSEDGKLIKLELWRFVEAPSGLPAVNLNGGEWISQLRKNLGELLTKIGINNPPNLNQKIKKTGLDNNQQNLPMFDVQALFPPIRQETIHKVKGESIDAVLVLGSTKFWNSVVTSVVAGENSDDRRLRAQRRAYDLSAPAGAIRFAAGTAKSRAPRFAAPYPAPSLFKPQRSC